MSVRKSFLFHVTGNSTPPVPPPGVTFYVSYNNDTTLYAVTNKNDKIDWAASEINETTTNYKIYSALISQDSPLLNKTSSNWQPAFVVGQLWTINNYEDGDDFSNYELVSGVMNTTDCVFRIIGDAYDTAYLPTVWLNNTTISYDGVPYVVSVDSVGKYAPHENTIPGNIYFTKGGDGNGGSSFSIVSDIEAFVRNKTHLKFGIIDNVYAAGYMTYKSSSSDASQIQCFPTIGSQPSSNHSRLLHYTPIEIKIYN